MCIKMEEERYNLRRLSAPGVNCQLVHQLPADTFPIHHLLLGVCKKQGGGNGKNDVMRLLQTKDRY